MLEYYQISSSQTPEVPYPSSSNPTGPPYQNGAQPISSSPPASTPHFRYNPNDIPSQRASHAHPHNRIRTSESPPSTYRSIPSSYTPSPPPGPSSPYSSCSASVDESPRSRDAMAIGSLLSPGARKPRDDVGEPLQKDLVCEDRSQLCMQ